MKKGGKKNYYERENCLFESDDDYEMNELLKKELFNVQYNTYIYW